MMRKRRQSLRTKRKQPKIKTKGMGCREMQPYFYVIGNALWGCASRGEVNNALHIASGSLPRQAQVCGRRTLYSVSGNDIVSG